MEPVPAFNGIHKANNIANSSPIKKEESFFGGRNVIEKPFFSAAIIQTKLTMGERGDQYEQQADEVADKVIQRMAAPHKVHAYNHSSPEKAERLPGMEEEEATETLPNPNDKITLQAKKLGEANTEIPGAAFEQRLQSSKGNGTALDHSSAAQMNEAFGHDFSNVKIHTGTDAVQMSSQIGARAFTSGSDIYFNDGQYSPSTTAGTRLIAHELTHVVQQGMSVPVNVVQRDLAIEPANPEAIARELTPEEIQSAITFNQRRFRNAAELSNLRDVLGLDPVPAVVDEEFILTVVQWQAENNQEQDGKIGPLMARIIGAEMLEEAKTDPTQKRPARQMLERGITLSLTRNRYVDTATTSQKNIQFNVFIPQGLNMRDYALVNFISGQILRVPGPRNPNVRMYGNLVPFNFAAEQVDSTDTDPIYWSTAASRWNFNVAGRTFTATDGPGRPDGTFNPGDTADLNFRIGVFRVADLPAATAGNVGTARPLVDRNWEFSVVRDAVTGNITHP